MQSFDGPWSKDLESFIKSVQSTPDQYKSSLATASKTTLDILCNPALLHIWETDSDLDDLLQLTSVIAKLCDLGVRGEEEEKTKKKKGAKADGGSMLILVEEKPDRNNFARIAQLVAYLTGHEGKKHLEGTVVAFGKIVVVRGWDNAVQSGQHEAMDKAIHRVNTCIERVFKMGSSSSSSGAVSSNNKRKMVWHHGPVLYFLLAWIAHTSSALRSALAGITITGALDLTTRIAPSTAGRANPLPALERLESYARRLAIPAVFLDASSLSLTSPYLGSYMYFFAYYLHTLLPAALSRPHLYKAQDELLTFAFRLRAASEGRYGGAAVHQVQQHLDARQAKHWADVCVRKDSYTKEKCRAAARDESIHHAVLLADSPFARFNFTPKSHSTNTTTTTTSLSAFARLSVGPAAPMPSSSSSSSSSPSTLAIPITISYRTRQLRPSHPSPIALLIPAPAQTPEKATARVQGLMLAVLERVRQERGDPVLGARERNMWRAVREACVWALDGGGGGGGTTAAAARWPEGVAEKIGFVREKLGRGTWGGVLFAGEEGEGEEKKKEKEKEKKKKKKGGGVVGTATGTDPSRTFGFGQDPYSYYYYHHPQHQPPLQPPPPYHHHPANPLLSTQQHPPPPLHSADPAQTMYAPW